MPLRRSTPILVVDGRATSIRIVRDLFDGLGFASIETTRDTAIALDILRTTGPRLVIGDLDMRPVSGLQLLRTIRADEKLRQCPFIMAVTKLTAEQAAIIMHAGADGFVLKPFTRATLAAKIDEALATRGTPSNRLDTNLSEAVSSSLRSHLGPAR
jgi:two-component system chemotaxis response regulator CheY